MNNKKEKRNIFFIISSCSIALIFVSIILILLVANITINSIRIPILNILLLIFVASMNVTAISSLLGLILSYKYTKKYILLFILYISLIIGIFILISILVKPIDSDLCGNSWCNELDTTIDWNTDPTWDEDTIN